MKARWPLRRSIVAGHQRFPQSTSTEVALGGIGAASRAEPGRLGRPEIPSWGPGGGMRRESGREIGTDRFRGELNRPITRLPTTATISNPTMTIATTKMGCSF